MADDPMQIPSKCNLLCLPVEIRLQIYPYCCVSSPGSPRKFELQVLQLCRQIHDEAWPHFFAEYGRHQFRSLAEFIIWVEHAPSPYAFGFVKKVCFRFSEMSWEEMHAHGKLDAAILSSFMTSLASLHRVRTLQLDFRNYGDVWLKTRGSQSKQYHLQQQLCLDMIALKMRNIDSLDLSFNVLHVDFLQSFHNLRRLRFSGYALTAPERFLRILNTLANLEELELLHVTPQLYLINTDDISQNFAVSAAVLAAMSSSLKSISITYTDSDAGRTPPWFTIAWMKALLRHAKTLQYLKLHCYYQLMPADVFWVLLGVVASLEAQSLKHVELNLRVPNACMQLVSTNTSPSPRLCATKDSWIQIHELGHILFTPGLGKHLSSAYDIGKKGAFDF